MQDNLRVTHAAGTVGGLTVLSRMLGYIRDMMVAWLFGAGFYSDVFVAAFCIPNLARRLFSEGALSVAFIPALTRHLTERGFEEAIRFAGGVFKVFLILLASIVVIGFFLAPLILRGIAPGFVSTPDKFKLLIMLFRIMLPYILCIGLAGLCMGVLNMMGHFVAPALAPALLNLTMIAAMLGASRFFADDKARIVLLAVGVIVGGGGQLLLQLIVLIRKGMNLLSYFAFSSSGAKTVLWMLIPAVFGASVFQLNVLMGTLLASLLGQGSVSFLYYADRLIELPMGVFAFSIATAVYPTLSQQAALNERMALMDTFHHAMKLVFFVMLPSMIGLIVLREPIVALLFKRGAFDESMTRLTASALLYYGIGIWAFSAVRITVSVFFALNDFKTPVKAGLLSVSANIILGLFLMKGLSHSGLALATSISAVLNLWVLLRALQKKVGHVFSVTLWRSIGGSILCSTVMGIIIWAIGPFGMPGSLDTMFRLVGCILSGVLVYAALSYAVNRGTLLRALSLKA